MIGALAMHEWQQAHVSARRSLELAHQALRAGGLDPSDDDGTDPVGIDGRWMVLANVMFLEGVSRYSGASAPMICRARVREPETAELLSTVGPVLFASPELEVALEQAWPMIEAAAQARADRRRG